MKKNRTIGSEKTEFRKGLEKDCKKCWKSHGDKEICEKTCAFGHIKKKKKEEEIPDEPA